MRENVKFSQFEIQNRSGGVILGERYGMGIGEIKLILYKIIYKSIKRSFTVGYTKKWWVLLIMAKKLKL